jgi:hypothetical protein
MVALWLPVVLVIVAVASVELLMISPSELSGMLGGFAAMGGSYVGQCLALRGK